MRSLSADVNDRSEITASYRFNSSIAARYAAASSFGTVNSDEVV